MATKQKLKVSMIERINKGYERIKKLDQGLIAVEKFAMRMADKDGEIKFKLKLAVPSVDKKKKVLDADGDLLPDYMEAGRLMHEQMAHGIFGPSILIPRMINFVSKDDADKWIEDIDEATALEVLGVIVGRKQKERKNLLKQLRSWGVEV